MSIFGLAKKGLGLLGKKKKKPVVDKSLSKHSEKIKKIKMRESTAKNVAGAGAFYYGYTDAERKHKKGKKTMVSKILDRVNARSPKKKKDKN